MKYVLLIPGWFPSRVNFLAGDFIERHAAAASLYFPVVVLFCVKDDKLPAGKTEMAHRQVSANYHQYIVYYSSRTSFRITEKLRSAWMQRRSLIEGWKLIRRQHGLPSLVHAHVLLKHAWFALRIAKHFRIPLLASEQWTGYLPEAKGEFETLSWFQRRMIRQTLRHASHLTTVSQYLAMQIRRRFWFRDSTVIPNLVQSAVFKPGKKPPGGKTSFIHISTLSPQKNFDGIITACVSLMKSQIPFRLVVVGPPHAYYHQLIRERGLETCIEFQPEQHQADLAKKVAAADALLLYSNYETFGCVIVEANACGIPVIVSDFPVFEENVIDGVTGMRVPLGDPAALARAMTSIAAHEITFNVDEIVSITHSKYSAEVVGKQFAETYQRFANP